METASTNKAKLGKDTVTKWGFRPFENQGRKDGLRLSHWVKAAEPAKRFHMAASRASERRSTSSMEALWANELLWWTPVVNTFNANERWLKLYEDNIDAWQFERWVSKYPVPPNHRSALMVAALEGGKA